MTTEERINKYAELQAEASHIKDEMDALKSEILDDLENEEDGKITTAAGFTAQVIDKITFKYIDELAMIKFLIDNGYGAFVKESINAQSMNNELKKNGLLSESLSRFYQKVESKALKVS